MIKNEKEYTEAKSRLEEWKNSFATMQQKLPPESFAVYKDIHEPILDELMEKISEYESLKLNQKEVVYFNDPMKVGGWLIRERIRQKLSQNFVAERVRLSQAQISRDEDAEYRTLPFMRLCEIANVLGYPIMEIAFFRNMQEMIEFNRQKLGIYSNVSVSRSVFFNQSFSIGATAYAS